MENNIEHYKNKYGLRNKLYRVLWILTWSIFAKPLPRSLFHGWKRFLLRLFGAKIANNAVIESGVRIFLPYNLTMKEYSCISSGVTLHNVDMVTIGYQATISQGAFICAGDHDISDPKFHQRTRPINIGDYAWVAVEAFVGMGVTIGEGAVVAARGVVMRDVEPWTVVGGNPAKFIKKRVIKDE